MELKCLFCDRDNKKCHKIPLENDLAYFRWDNFPVSDGHGEIVPKRHVNSYFELEEPEIIAINELILQAKVLIDDKYKPDSYNIGINDGEAAGQTIPHVHVHLIPRYIGDVQSPRVAFATSFLEREIISRALNRFLHHLVVRSSHGNFYHTYRFIRQSFR